MTCLTDDTVFDLVQGQITGPALIATEQHLASCGRCREGVAASARLLGGPSSSASFAHGSRRQVLVRGTVIGRYTILESIGVGAVGVVYVAHDAQLKRRIALKILPAERSDMRERWMREAHAMAQVSHPNVVTVFDAGVHGDMVFIAMELVGGKTLAEWMAETRRGWREILPLFLDAARGLEAAHAAGFVHRDFKPHNVLVGDDGRARVADFGLACMSDSPVADALTTTGALVGTPAYMGPEQFAGREVDARTDQFAFCVTFFEACCGQRPFTGNELAAVAADVTRCVVPPPPPTTQLPRWLFEILRRGLASDPNRRHETMAELITATERGMAHETRRPRTRRAIAFITTAALLAAGATAWMLSLLAAGRCGNGTVEAAEDCDDGNDSDTDACLNSCKQSHCGDGFVRAVVEECDDGNKHEGDGCTAVCLACNGANKYVGRNGHCYTRHDDSQPYREARLRCREEGGNLVTYTSGYEAAEVLKALLHGRPMGVWTAMARKGQTPFWDTPELMPTNVLGIDWRSPAEATEGECALQEPILSENPMPESGVWSPRPCATPAPFICERVAWTVRAQDGHAYRPYLRNENWKTSAETCRQVGAHLVTISSAEEHAFVRDLFAGQMWLSGRVDNKGRFAWSTGEPFNYTNFAVNEPDGSLPQSSCLAVDVDGLWHDRQCTNGYAAVCEVD